MRYLKELIRLNLPKDKFVIFGSGPLAIRNLRENKDIDIIVKEELWQELIKKYGKYKNKERDEIKINHVSIYKDAKYKDLQIFNNINELIDNTDVFRGMRFVKLEYVLKWKTCRGLKKDKKDINIINDYLNV